MSNYRGDYAVGETVHLKFCTVDDTGAPTTLAGTPAIRVYKDNGTTEDDSGITLSVDFDAVTGLNHVAIDTSADGTFYSTASDFQVVITSGTVDSVSVVGYVVGEFSLGNRAAFVRLGAPAGASVSADVAAVKVDTAAILVDTGTTLDGKIDTIDTNVDAILVDTGTTLDGKLDTIDTNVDSILVDTGTTLDGKLDTIDTNVDSILADTGTTGVVIVDGGITATKFGAGAIDAAAAAADFMDEIWDEPDAGHTTADTLGNTLRLLKKGALGLVPFTVGAGATTTAISTNLTEATDDHYNGGTVVFLTGALTGQRVSITDYTGATKVLTVSAATEAPAENDLAVIV